MKTIVLDDSGNLHEDVGLEELPDYLSTSTPRIGSIFMTDTVEDPRRMIGGCR